ncbi:unnamed protein product [Orchesella dallaii]|uniref:Uncharacterized protein n=1 Tax=Orchesella dallaii TaxID=48710 RepID=A0ABP1Q1Z1_9HEXA
MSGRENLKLVNGVKILAVIDGVCGWFFDVFLILALFMRVVFVMVSDDPLANLTNDGRDAAFVISLSVVAIICLLLILLAVKLYLGAKNNDLRSFQIWRGVTIVLVFLHIIGLILSFICGRFDVFFSGLYIVQIGYKTYEMKLVDTFMEVLEK